MRTARKTMDMAQILSILQAIAGQLDFRAVIRAVSSQISGPLRQKSSTPSRFMLVLLAA